MEHALSLNNELTFLAFPFFLNLFDLYAHNQTSSALLLTWMYFSPKIITAAYINFSWM